MDDFTQEVLALKIGPEGQTFQEYVASLRWPMDSFHQSVLEERSHQLKIGNNPTPENVGFSLAGDLARVLADLRKPYASSSNGG